MYPHTKKQLLVEAIDLVGLIQSVVGDRPFHELSKEVAAGVAAISRNLRDTLEALHEAENGTDAVVESCVPRAPELTSPSRIPESSEPTAFVQVAEPLPPVAATSSTVVPVVSTSTPSQPTSGAPIIRRQTMQVGQSKLRDFGGSAQVKH